MQRRLRTWALTSLAALLTAAATTAAALPQPAAATTATIDASTTYQPIDGFGFSEHFGRAAIMNGSQGLSAQHQKEILDLLLERSTGAGLSILRLGIDSGIQPTDPGGPNATPKYTWDGIDKGQVWLAEQAKAYGVNRFYADAWTAPGYMKTNGTDADGGTLCGLSGATCASGDWKKAYANFLVQYARFYRQEGIRITDLGFTNEPDWTATYDSMRLTPAQAVEFIRTFGPIARAAGYQVACCDSFGWDEEKAYSSAIEADAKARGYVTTHTGHTYASKVDGPLPTHKRTWMSEWSPDGTTWNENWDDGSGYDGFTVASAVHDALTKGNTSGYVYWYGASLGATRGLIQMDGDNYHVSKRLWALANYSRFIRPGATRIGATTSDTGLKLSAFRNTDGTVTVVALNTSTSATPVTFDLKKTGIAKGTATPYLTDATHNTAQQQTVAVGKSSLTATVPARALVTYTLRR
ncbi:glycoside hydrolase family 30 protein [Streptomyces sp. NPDC001537]